MKLAREIPPFRLFVRVKNNRLIRLREELGLTQREAAERMGVSVTVCLQFENFKRSPLSRSGGQWTEMASKIAAFHGVSPEWIWPEEIALLRRSAMTVEVASVEGPRTPVEELESKELASRSRLLMDKTLTKYWANALHDRFSGLMYSEIAAKRGVSVNCSQQDVAKGYRRLWEHVRASGDEFERQAAVLGERGERL